MTQQQADVAPVGAAFWNPRRIDAKRSMVLSAVGAAIGLLIAGFGLFTAHGTRTAAVPAEDAALVNNVPILRADLVSQVRALYSIPLSQASPEQKRKVLDDMVREELYVQRGIELGLANDDIDVRNALVTSAEAQVAADAQTASPTRAELRAWYDVHRARYASDGFMQLHEWIVPPARAAQAAAALRAGSDAAALGLRSSGRVDDGDEFYFAARIHIGPALFAAAERMGDGEVSEPLIQPDGAHILQMVRNTRPKPYSYEQAATEVEQDFMRDKVARLQAGNGRFLAKRADIKVADDLR